MNSLTTNAGKMKHRNLPTIALAAGLIFAFGLALTFAQPLRAEDSAPAQTIDLNAGQTRIIDHLKIGTKPAIRVIDNPDALVIHDETPGQVVLLGAGRGQWQVTVTREDGTPVAYRVNVSGIANSAAPLDAGSGPLASGDQNSTDPPVPARKDSPAIQTSQISQLAGTIDHDGTPAPGQYVSNPLANVDAPIARGEHNYLPADVVSVMTGTSQVIDFPRRLRRVSVADSTVADIQVTNPYQLNLIGHRPGFTTLAVWDDQGHYVERQVRIEPGGKQQVMLNAIVAELDRSKLETQGVNISAALLKAGISLTSLPGLVGSPYGPTSQLTAGTDAVPGIPPVGGQLLPLLLSSNMTYALSTSTSALATQSLFQFLETHSLGRILAQPHLLAYSGQSASFLSGGEIPIVLAQALNTSIVFKQFGTQVNCRPTVIGRDDIELLVKSEVSEPDYAHGVQLFGFTVPSFVTRRADTLVRLKDGQNLIIAGLILRSRNAVVNKVPYLGDLPYAGAIFRNTNWQDQETELVMSVQPQIVRPLPPNAQIFEPSERGPLTEDEIRTKGLDTPDAARPRF